MKRIRAKYKDMCMDEKLGYLGQRWKTTFGVLWDTFGTNFGILGGSWATIWEHFGHLEEQLEPLEILLNILGLIWGVLKSLLEALEDFCATIWKHIGIFDGLFWTI